MKKLWIALPLFAACAPDLAQVADPDGTDSEVGVVPPMDLIAQSFEDGSWQLIVDASETNVEARIDLDTLATVEDDSWDFGMSRVNAWTHADTGLLVFEGADFDDPVDVSGDNWLTEGAASAALEAWYNYDQTSHAVTAKDNLFVIKTDAGGIFKVQIETYYATAGTPATISLHVADITPAL